MGLDQMHFLQGGYAVTQGLLQPPLDPALSTDSRPGGPVIHPTSRVAEVRKSLTGQPWGEASGAWPLNPPP